MSKVIRTHPKEVTEFEFNYIDDGVYIGTNLCCQSHFDESLLKDGVAADISMEAEQVDTPYGVEFYVWIPVEDHKAPTQGQLEFGVSTLEKLIGMGKKIYLHCQHGHGRSPTLFAAYLIKTRNMDVEQASEFIKERRSTIHITEPQTQALQRYKAKLAPTSRQG